MQSNRARKIILLLGDITLLYLSLFLALTLRYGSLPSETMWNIHQVPFFFVYLLWILIFYIAGLYDIEKFISVSSLFSRVFRTMATAGTVAVVLFYLFPFFNIAPKTNLVIDGLLVFLFILVWRVIFFNLMVKSSKIKVYFLGKNIKKVSEFAEFLSQKPQMGYEPVEHTKLADIVIVPEDLKRDPEITHSLYEMTLTGKTIIGFDRFYEMLTGKIPVSLISEEWFFDNLTESSKQGFEKFKRVFDLLLAVIFLVPYLVILPFIALAIKLNSRGSVFYLQQRVGKNGEIFKIIKFRSMVADAEKDGAQWATKKDTRITFMGNIMRKTRIDELPQIWNVLRGDLSFVGPRPERPEFVKELDNAIPFYQIRHLVKPGLSGWAQINFPYGASVEDATEKLQYDLYYIKNRSVLLEFIILLKTTLVVLSQTGR